MAEQEIALLEGQIERLGEKKFDLEAWKNHTLIFLERIFGKDSSKLKMIKDLGYDYSSWNLRDTAAAGKTSDKDPVLMQAEEILTATITELKLLGLPKSKQEKEKIWDLLTDELTGKQLRELENLVKSEELDKTEKITNILEELEKEKLASILLKLLTD
jgi:CO dehydrogenase/acetyl-CoA synthase alpha subunit